MSAQGVPKTNRIVRGSMSQPSQFVQVENNGETVNVYDTMDKDKIIELMNDKTYESRKEQKQTGFYLILFIKLKTYSTDSFILFRKTKIRTS